MSWRNRVLDNHEREVSLRSIPPQMLPVLREMTRRGEKPWAIHTMKEALMESLVTTPQEETAYVLPRNNRERARIYREY